MPIPIFQFIQKFLNEQDYLDLMNSNLSTFQPIKYETVHYTLVGPERWVYFDFCAEEHKEATVLQIISGVRDKSKQIAMRFMYASQTLLLQYAHLFEGIRRVQVDEAIIEKDFPFVIFNKIRHLKLSCFGEDVIHQKSQANFDLENLEELELDNCSFGKIVAWNSSKSLKKVIISSCRPFSSIPPLDDIPVVSITSTPSLTRFQSKGNHEKFTCVGFLDKSTLQLMNQPSFYKKLQNLKLWCTFTFPDISFCQNIPVIELHNTSQVYRNEFYAALPILHGRELKLQHFSLSSWNRQQTADSFSNVIRCELRDCIDLIDFPEMNAVQYLRLKKCIQLVSIPALASLKTLWVGDCPMMTNISYSPNLKNVTLETCKSVKDLSVFSHVEKISLYIRKGLSSCVPLQRVPKVTIRACSEIVDVSKISNPQDDYMAAKRVITLASVRVREKLQDIYHLVLERYSLDSANLSKVGNIHHLEIRGRFTLETTEKLAQ
jgi:hypothetical protein